MQRATITSTFIQRSCHVLPHPGCDTTVMESLVESQMSQKFVTVSVTLLYRASALSPLAGADLKLPVTTAGAPAA
jgi:hypothetical protein